MRIVEYGPYLGFHPMREKIASMPFEYKRNSVIFMQDSDYFYTIDAQKVFQILKSHKVWAKISEGISKTTDRPSGLDRLLMPITKQVEMPNIDHAVLNEAAHRDTSQLISSHLYPSWSFGSVYSLVNALNDLVNQTARNREKFQILQKSVSDFNRQSVAAAVSFNETLLFGALATRDLSAAILLAVAVVPVTMIGSVSAAASLAAIGTGSAINAIAAYQDNVFDSQGVMLPQGRRIGQALAVGGLSFTLAAFGGSSAILRVPSIAQRAAANQYVVVTVGCASAFATSIYSGESLLTAVGNGLIPISDPLLGRMLQSSSMSSILNQTIVPALFKKTAADPRITLETSRAVLGAATVQVRDKGANMMLEAYGAPKNATDIAPSIVGVSLGAELTWPSLGVQMQFKGR